MRSNIEPVTSNAKKPNEEPPKQQTSMTQTTPNKETYSSVVEKRLPQASGSTALNTNLLSAVGSESAIQNGLNGHTHKQQTTTTQTSPRTTSRSGNVTHVQEGDLSTTIMHKGPLTREVTDQVLQGKQNISQQRKYGSGNTQQIRPVGRYLRGVNREKGTAICITQIAIEGREEDDEIGQMIMSFCESKGLRVMKYRIFRYRSVYDTVGCRIIVPESQEHKALDPDIWPDKIVVRRWKSREEYDRERQPDWTEDAYYNRGYYNR